MSIVYVLVGISLALAATFLAAFIWATRTGQFRDCATPALRVLNDAPLSQSKVNISAQCTLNEEKTDE